MAAGTLLVIGAGLGLLSWLSGGSSSDDAPVLGPLPLPGTPTLPWATIDAAVCAIYDGGTTQGDAIVAELWRRTYPGAPYPVRVPPAHATHTVALANLGARVSTILQRVPVCGDPDVDEPDDVPDVEVPDTPAGRAQLVSQYTTQREDGLFAVSAANAGAGGLTDVVRTAYAIPGTPISRVRAAARCTVQVGWNLLMYGVRRPGNDYGRGRYQGRWYDVNSAMLPRNADVVATVLAGERVRRQVSWTGNSTGGGARYGRLWIPSVERQGSIIACSEDIWDPERNPPAELLAAMGWTLDEAREAFEQSPLAA